MRLFHILALSTLLSAPAFAADLGTYRPGSPYHSVMAPGADVCENQCAGDAQCRGWNYVKVNPRAPGVCEFNSKPANPIESAISISGQGAESIAPNLSVGSTNTVRVGTSAIATQRPTVRRTSQTQKVVRQPIPQQIRPEQMVARRNALNGNFTTQAIQRPSVQQASPTQRIVRQPIPQQIRPDQMVLRRPVPNANLSPQQNFHRQSRAHAQPWPQNPQQLQQQPAQQLAARSEAQPRLLRDPRIANQRPVPGQQFQYNLDGVQRPIDPRFANPNAVQGAAGGLPPQGRPPIGVPIAGKSQNLQSQAVLPQGSVNNPVTHQNAQSRIREAEIAAVQHAAQARRQSQNFSIEQAQESLFGNLNDDVKSPRPLINLPNDPNAPIATAQSRPSLPVSQEPLGVLAGG